MICELCEEEFESNEGTIYDDGTFVCFGCQDELETESMNWNIKNE